MTAGSDGSILLQSLPGARARLRAESGAKINGVWVRSRQYPQHEVVKSNFQDDLGPGDQLTITHSGLAGKPDLLCAIRVYKNRPWGDFRLTVKNTTESPLKVADMRLLEASGEPLLDLGSPENDVRVLSDSYSEDTPVLRIHDLADKGLHLGVGSQLVYNRSSHQSLLLGALTSDRWLTLLHLRVDRDDKGHPKISSYTVDSAGTTEVTSGKSLDPSRPQDHIELQLPVDPGEELSSEKVLFALGTDYHRQLEDYSEAIRVLHHARVNSPAPSGWWSFTAFYLGINQAVALTNAQYLATHLKDLGYNFVHIDEGYDYVRGEYTSVDASHFPDGMEAFSRKLAALGLKLGLWVAPFEVAERSFVYQNHPEWLVHNYQGEPIHLGKGVYALDPTNPDAQAYLQHTYSVLAHRWGACYIKMDFMETSSVEGKYYRPNTTALEAERIGLQTIREAVGDDVMLDKDGSAMLVPVGIVDEGRISNDTEHSFVGSRDAASGIAARYYMNRNFFVSDPDAFCVSNHRSMDPRWEELAPVTFDEAKVAIVLSALAGGMFENGDDLPSLATEPERLALLRNPDLLQMVRLGRAAVPLDLMSYQAEDQEPSIFLLREDRRQTMLAVFNWTGGARDHRWAPALLNLPESKWLAYDVLDGNRQVEFRNGAIEVSHQPPHSVRLIKLINSQIPAAAPTVTTQVPNQGKTGETIKMQATIDPNGVPPVACHWDFGDGTATDGASVAHAFTYAGTHKVRLTVVGVDGLDDVKEFQVSIRGEVLPALTRTPIGALLNRNDRYRKEITSDVTIFGVLRPDVMLTEGKARC